MGKKIKKEVAEDTHLRQLFTYFVAEAEEEMEIKLTTEDKAAMVDDLVEDFGGAIEAVALCAVDASFALVLAEDDEEGEDEEGEDEEGEDEEGEDEEEEGTTGVIEAEFEEKSNAA
jgi:hypothetical protein